MYIYMFMFPLLKLASANSQVTLVTSSGAFKNLSFRKVWFYLVKPLLLGANVCKTLRPGGAAPTAASALGGPWREALWQLFRTFCIFIHPGVLFRVILDALGDVFSFLFSIWRFTWFFFAFWTSRGPSRTPKNHENHCTVIQIQGFANFKKITF